MITAEQFYDKLETALRKQGDNLNTFQMKLSDIINKKVNLKSSKQKGNFPVAKVIPFMDFPCFSDDELHYICLKRLEMMREDDPDEEIIDSFMAELEPSKAYLEKQRIRRQMKREAA
jgi:hypothetical protein